MKTVLTRCILVSIIVVLLLSQTTVVNAVIPVDDGYGTSSSAYRGPYDLSAEHDVNRWFSKDPERCANNIKTIYQHLLTWGMTRSGAAAVCGSVYAECGGDYTVTESWVDWSSFKFGTTGLGMIGFTYWTLQADLFNTAESMGKQWTDLEVQLEVCKHYFGPDELISARLYDPSWDGKTEELAIWFTDTIERPAASVSHTSLRVTQAVAYYEEFADLEAVEYNGTTASGANAKPVDIISVTKEWELVGMPVKSDLTANARAVHLTQLQLDYKDANDVAEMGQYIEQRNEFDAWQTARTAIVFAGLVLVIYALFLMLGMLLDKVNGIFDISFVTLFSFGVIRCSSDTDALTNPRSVVSTKRAVIAVVTIAVVGVILVSGGVLPYLLRAVYWVYDKLR